MLPKPSLCLSFCVALLLGRGEPAPAQAPARAPLSYRAAAKIPDRLEPLIPSQIQMRGYLGERVANNAKNRLLLVDTQPLLAGYRKRPGNHPWIGEHIGKWLHAATLAWANAGDAALKAKLDRAANELISAQEPDGYLGTYTPETRFGLFPNADWDVWSHKYNLIGLLTYYQYTGDAKALRACERMGDLLIATFGTGKKSILSAGTHMGMAATSVLEPMVLLYRHTNESRYLDFAKQIVAAWDEPNGPRVLSTLSQIHSVEKTANGKAYEMLSNLVGLCELARATGEQKYLVPALYAWDDVVANHLYLTGTASHGEHFHAPRQLPNQPSANIGETCVTVTWIQLTSQLLRLTGMAKYGDELERSYYNHLAAAQRPDGREWCYYTALEGAKPYGPGINCCVSSGPRGMAMATGMVFFKRREDAGDTLLLNLFEHAIATLTLGGERVRVTLETGFPRTSGAKITFAMDRPTKFGFQVRVPSWAQPLRIQGQGVRAANAEMGWLRIPPRTWKNGESLSLSFALKPRIVMGTHSNAGRAALMRGPLVLAYDESQNAALGASPYLSFATGKASVAALRQGRLQTVAEVRLGTETKTASFVPFAEAGTAGSRYRIWLGAPGKTIPVPNTLFWNGTESRTRDGNQGGSILDGDNATFVVTYDGAKRAEDWFAVTVPKIIAIERIVYAHGKTFHDGGWFDASAGKPRIQILRQSSAKWEDLAVLETYPNTTATDPKGLVGGETFTLNLAEPVTVIGVRILGKPAHGDRPEQAFASCAELQAFAKGGDKPK